MTAERPDGDTDDDLEAQHEHGTGCDHDHGAPLEPFRRAGPKLGRNDPCHCGSGRKFKKCHGAA